MALRVTALLAQRLGTMAPIQTARTENNEPTAELDNSVVVVFSLVIANGSDTQGSAKWLVRATVPPAKAA